jgi:ankyrin repeat protein
MTPRSKDDTKELLADIMRILSFKLYKWPSAKWSREEAHRYAESHRSFVEQWVADFGYTPDRLEALAGEMISYFGTKINESLRDKMTPKSSEDIKNILRNKTPNEIFQIGVRLGDSEIVRSAFERDRGINIVYPELTSIVVGNKLDIVKTILEYQPQAIYRIIKAVIENMNFSSPHALMDKHRTKLETYIMLSDIPEQEILDKSLIYLCHVDSGYGIRLLSYMGADIHQDNEEPLMQAIYNGRHHSVKTLLSLGADPTVDNNRPLEEARRRKYYDIADIISKHISSLPFRKRLSRYIPFLKESVRAKMTPISDENMRKKIKGMKLDRYRQFVEDEMGVIPRRRKNHIYVSVIEDRLKELRLPKEVADEIVNMTEEEQLRRMGYDIENMIPLGRFFTGIRYGFLDLVQQALDTGEVNVDCMNGGPLDNAVASGDEELVELLLKNGASVDKRDYQYTNEQKHRNPKIKELLDRYAI